jgi:hypothetical protein
MVPLLGTKLPSSWREGGYRHLEPNEKAPNRSPQRLEMMLGNWLILSAEFASLHGGVEMTVRDSITGGGRFSFVTLPVTEFQYG